MKDIFTSKVTYSPKAKVSVEYDNTTYEGSIGMDEIEPNGLIGFDFTLSEGEGTSNCKVEVFDEDRVLANLLFKYVDKLGGLNPVVDKTSGDGSSSGGGFSGGSGDWRVPITGTVTSLHGIRNGKNHNGVDISSVDGTGIGGQVYAAKSGKVTVNQFQEGGAGWWVEIDHGDGYASRYFHLHTQSPLQVGDEIEVGHFIGDEGNTGNSRGTHLHFEVLKGGSKIDPATMHSAFGKKGTQVTGGTPFDNVKHTETSSSSSEPVNGIASSNISNEEKAFLDMTAWAEGTYNHNDQNGYNIIVGYTTFSDYSRHPDVYVPSVNSDAAGRYQFLYDTWTGLGYPNFSPENQDKGALDLAKQGHSKSTIKNSNALGDITSGDIETAIKKTNGIWASFPGSPYGQPIKTMDDMLSFYNDRLQAYGGGNAAEGSYASSTSPSNSGSTTANTSPNGGDIKITVYIDDVKSEQTREVEFTYIHTGVEYREETRTTVIYGQSVAFKLGQKLLNTSYENVTLKQIFEDLATQSGAKIEMEDSDLVYEYFTVNNKSAYKAILKEARRLGAYVDASPRGDGNIIRITSRDEHRNKLLELLAKESVDEIDELPELEDIITVNKPDITPQNATQTEVYILRNGFNAGLSTTFSHKADDQISDTTTDGLAKFDIDPDDGTIVETADAKVKGNVDGVNNNSAAIPEDKPVYKDESEDTENESEGNKQKKGKASFVYITASDEQNNNGNRLWNVQVIKDGETLETFQTISGRAAEQFGDKNESGKGRPSPDGVYTIRNDTPPDLSVAELGGVFYAYYPEFPTNRSSLGFHWDPSWGSREKDAKGKDKDGTEGCHAFQTLSIYNKFIGLIEEHGITRLVIEENGNPNTIGSEVNDAEAQYTKDAANRSESKGAKGVKLNAVLPIDEQLLQLNPTDVVETQGFGVDKFRQRVFIEGAVDDYLDRMWLVASITHNFFPNGYTTTLQCESPFDSRKL